MVYPHKWLPISCKLSAGQANFAGERPAFYHCATQPTITGLLDHTCIARAFLWPCFM